MRSPAVVALAKGPTVALATGWGGTAADGYVSARPGLLEGSRTMELSQEVESASWPSAALHAPDVEHKARTLTTQTTRSL